jgi:hypothetical protein
MTSPSCPTVASLRRPTVARQILEAPRPSSRRSHARSCSSPSRTTSDGRARDHRGRDPGSPGLFVRTLAPALPDRWFRSALLSDVLTQEGSPRLPSRPGCWEALEQRRAALPAAARAVAMGHSPAVTSSSYPPHILAASRGPEDAPGPAGHAATTDLRRGGAVRPRAGDGDLAPVGDRGGPPGTAGERAQPRPLPRAETAGSSRPAAGPGRTGALVFGPFGAPRAGHAGQRAGRSSSAGRQQPPAARGRRPRRKSRPPRCSWPSTRACFSANAPCGVRCASW